MKATPTSIEGAVVLHPSVFSDDRGWFMELFKESTFAELGVPARFVQDNVSESRRGVVRGLHFQVEPFAQGKLVTCLKGAIFDVLVDLRPDSPTFGEWQSVELSELNRQALYIPEGMAHGFQALADWSRVFYKCTTIYSKQHEHGIRYNDPELAIAWPLPARFVSPKDLDLPSFAQWKKENLP